MAWEVGAIEFAASTSIITTLYVSPTGNDANTGTTPSSPLKTLQFAFSRLSAGGTIYLMTGTFTDTDPRWHTLKGGSSFSAPTTVTTYNGTVTIKPSSNTPTGQVVHLYTTTCKYIIVSGIIFDATNVTDNCVKSNNQTGTGSSSNVRFTGCTFKNAPSNGVYVVGTGSNEFINCTAQNNTSAGFYLDDDNELINGCTVHDNGTDGIATYAATSAIIKNNTCYNHASGAGIRIEQSATNKVYNNVVHDNTEGISIVDGTTSTGVYNNTVVNNTSSGIRTLNTTSAIIENNITYGNGGTEPIQNDGGSTYTADHNLFGTDPYFVSASDFHLTASSPALDTGVNLSSIFSDDHDGNGRTDGLYDRGAYEYQGAFVTSPVDAPTIVSGATVNKPAIRYIISMPTKASGASINTPVVAGLTLKTVSLPTKASGASVRTPSIAYRVSNAFITNTATLYSPYMGYVVRPPALTSGTLYIPSVAYVIDGPTISSGESATAPTVYVDIPGVQLAFPPTYFNSNAVRTPIVAAGSYPISTPTISTGSAVTTPTIDTENTLSGTVYTNTNILYVPAVALVPVQAIINTALANSSTLYEPSLTYVLTTPYLSDGPTLYIPSTDSLHPPTIASGNTVYGPDVISLISLPTIAVGSTEYIPMLAGGAENPTGISYITVYMWKRIS